MNIFLRSLIFVTSLPNKLWNKFFNCVASFVSGRKLVLNWSDARIIGASKINFGGDFFAGRGLWLQTIGESGEIRIGHGARLSDWVHIGAADKIIIGDNVLIGSNVLIIDHSHGCGSNPKSSGDIIPPHLRPLVCKGSVLIGNNVWLGDGVIVLPGASIGDNCIIGANSVVTGHIPSFTTALGSPARFKTATNSRTVMGEVHKCYE